MKKFFILVSATAIALLTGCTAQSNPENGLTEDMRANIAEASAEANSIETYANEYEKLTSEAVYSQGDAEFITWSEHEQISLEEAISESHCVVRARYDFLEEFEEYVEYHLQLADTYKGSAEDEIIIRWDKEFSDEFEPVFSDGDYILPLKYFDNVYFDYPFYNVVGHIIIPCDIDGGIQSVSVDGLTAAAPSELSDVEKAAAFIAEVEDTSKVSFKDYIRSDVPEEIAEGSEYIVKAVINAEPSRTGSDRGLYWCDTVECYKGDIDERFRVLLFYDDVEEGGEYYLFLLKNEGSAYYTISSKNSVYRSDNAEIANIVSDNIS